jgi:uncharacterized membrane protein (Fun14 family)
MTYEERFKRAAENKTLKSLTPQWVQFDAAGKSVCGELLGTSEVAGTLGSGTYLQYLMRTDNGLVKFALGSATDRELKAVLVVGGVYRITYIGQQKIKGGKRVNRFDVVTLTEDVEEPVQESDVPF